MNAPAPLQGAERMLGAVMLAAATFMVVLDITVANVSVATIAGDLGVSATQGTWIVTSYAAAQAIAMPLTGWLTRRFGQVRLIVASVLLFTAFIMLAVTNLMQARALRYTERSR